MKQTNKVLFPETAPFVEALRLLCKVESTLLEGFVGIYGEEEEGKKDTALSLSGIPDTLSSLKDKVKEWIGNSLELGMCGLLASPGDPSLVSKKEED